MCSAVLAGLLHVVITLKVQFEAYREVMKDLTARVKLPEHCRIEGESWDGDHMALQCV